MKTEVLNLGQHFEKFIGMLVEFTPKLIAAIIVFFIGLWLIQRLSKIANLAMQKREFDVSLSSFLRSLISIGLKVVLIVTVAGMIGIGTTSFVTILGAAGLAVGLALQGSLSNFAGGVLILIFKPYKVGDLIEALGQIGTVKEIQIFNSILLTGDLKTIILPNGSVSNGTIINYSKHGTLRGNVEVIVSATHNIDEVKKLIIADLLLSSIVLKEPAPEVAAIKIADNAVTLAIKPYASIVNFGLLNPTVVEIVATTFIKHNIQAPIQQRIIHNG